MDYNELEPKIVFQYFKEISNIPHGSGNTEAMQCTWAAACCLEPKHLRGSTVKSGKAIPEPETDSL